MMLYALHGECESATATEALRSRLLRHYVTDTSVGVAVGPLGAAGIFANLPCCLSSAAAKLARAFP